jgi:hypothetical protein
MSNKSRRRMKMAAGAILAGAAIPIAAAGAAWADDTLTTDQTERAGQLERQGLTGAEARDVVTAEKDGTPVQVSYDGQTVVNDNQSAADAASSGQATATSGGTHDVAAAIGDGSTSKAGTDATGAPVTGDIHDRAFANGAGANASVGYDATYQGTGTVSHDTATANGDGSESIVSNAGSAAVTNDRAIANGANSFASVLSLTGGTESVLHDRAIGSNGGTAVVGDDGSSTVQVTHDDATGNNGVAIVADAGDSKATAVNTGGFTEILNNGDADVPGAFVNDATHSTARAEGMGSAAGVASSVSVDDTPTVLINNGHATDTIGPNGDTLVTASGESMRNADNFPISESPAAVAMPDHMTLPLLP